MHGCVLGLVLNHSTPRRKLLVLIWGDRRCSQKCPKETYTCPPAWDQALIALEDTCCYSWAAKGLLWILLWVEAGNPDWEFKALMKFIVSYTGKIIISGVETFMVLLRYRIAYVSECCLSLYLRIGCISRTGNAECEQGAKSPLSIYTQMKCWLLAD